MGGDYSKSPTLQVTREETEAQEASAIAQIQGLKRSLRFRLFDAKVWTLSPAEVPNSEARSARFLGQ
jgi:hypothetical protein